MLDYFAQISFVKKVVHLSSRLTIFSALRNFGISQNLQVTALWSMLESFSSPIFSLLLIPIFTQYLGLDGYGLYVMVMAFVSFFSFTGLGMNTSMTYYLALSYGKSNPKEIAERLSSALIITFASTVFFSCLFMLALQIFTSLLLSNFPQLIAQQHLIYMALLLIVVTQLDTVISASLKGLQEFKMSSKVEFALRFLSFFIIAIVAITQKTVIAIVLITLLMAIFNLIIRFVALNNIVHFNYRDLQLNKKCVNELFLFGKWMTLQSIAGAFFGSIDKLLVGSILGNKVLGIYNLLLAITQLVHYIPANILVFIMPKVAKNNESISILLFKKIFVITSILAFIVAFILIILKQFVFLKFHVDSSYEGIYYWLIFSYVLLSLNIPSYFIALGMNLVKSISLQCILGSIIGVIVLLTLISKYGLLGAIFSKLIYSVVAIFLVIPVVMKMKIG